MRRLLHITTLASLLYWVGLTPLAAQSLPLDSMPQATQDEISQICLPVQYREGAQAYRTCVQSELSLRSGHSSSKLIDLTFDDKYAVQQACASAGAQSSARYQACVTDQITELNSVAEPNLDAATEDELYAVQQTCFAAQSKEGAANYRRCLNAEIDGLLAVPAADTSALSMLNKNALQLRCSANTSRAADYRKCIGSEFESIAGSTPTFLPISSATRVVSKQAAQPATSAVTKAVETIASQSVAPDQSATDSTVRVANAALSTTQASSTIEPIAQADTEANKPVMALPRNIDPTIVDTADAISTDLSTNEAANTANAGNTLRDATGNSQQFVASSTTVAQSDSEARVISRPALVQALEVQARENEQSDLAKPAPQAQTDAPSPAQGTGEQTDPLQPLKDIWQNMLQALGSLDRVGWIILAAVLALPALLLGLFSLFRRISRKQPEPTTNPALTERIEPGLQARKLRHEREAAELFGETNSQTDLTTETPASSKSPANPLARQTAHRPRVEAAPDNAEMIEPLPSDEATRFAKKPDVEKAQTVGGFEETAPDDNHWQSAFGHWLSRKPAEARLGHCIEFLIYWVAYGDDRYEPELKKQLFSAVDLNDHDQIKRWVLKQDVFAFADVVNWLRSNATKLQLEQTVGLIMALLVIENSVTPVQNTLLRFFADTFELGDKLLENNFESAFGHALPPVPRVDKLAWWEKQSDNELQRWDSRAIATLPVKQQMLARLGFTQPQNEAEVINAFRRAARRCHPDRFTALSERERALAERRFAKFEEARDRLLGVSV